jgi:UDP-N-acetyl-D-galactosamine dehydrogenase
VTTGHELTLAHRLPESVGVVGLGTVGLPVALAFGRKLPTTGYDVDSRRVALLRDGDDVHGLVSRAELTSCGARLTSDPEALRGCTAFLVTVGVSVDRDGHAGVQALEAACTAVGRVMGAGALVVVESTGWPGLTAGVCVPALERASGLMRGRGYSIAYSPERVNPGDADHPFTRTPKVVAADDEETLRRACALYAEVVEAPLHAVRGIRVAEAAKLLENVQRDVNIALLNEVSALLEASGIPTRDVVEAAATKWNYVPYRPGLVGGACVGPASRMMEQAGRLAGVPARLLATARVVNDGMTAHVVDRLLRLAARAGVNVVGARVGVLGCTYKSDVADARHSRVPELVRELTSLGMTVLVHDPVARAVEVSRHQAIHLVGEDAWLDLDCVVVAVAHASSRQGLAAWLAPRTRRPGAWLDLAWALRPAEIPPGVVMDAL